MLTNLIQGIPKNLPSILVHKPCFLLFSLASNQTPKRIQTLLPVSQRVLPGLSVHLVAAVSLLLVVLLLLLPLRGPFRLFQRVGGHLDEVGHQAGDAFLSVAALEERREYMNSRVCQKMWKRHCCNFQ